MATQANTFGELVRRLRLAHHLGQKELAERAHFAQSYVSQIERGRRYPSTARHVHNLASGLGVEAAEADALFRLAGFLPPAGASGRWDDAEATIEAPHKLAEYFLTGPPAPRNGSTLHQDDELPPRRTEIEGREKLLRAAIALVNEAPPRTVRQSRDPAIALTSQGADPFGGFPELRAEWQAALHAALKRRWDIQHLVRLDHSARGAFTYVEDMLTLLGSGAEGRYQPRYFPDYGLLKRPYDTLIVPRVGAMQLLSSPDESAVDHARFYPASEAKSHAVASLHDHFTWLWSQTIPLARTYTGVSLEFYNSVRDAAEQDGDWSFVWDRISERGTPAAVDRRRAEPVLRAGGANARLAREVLLNRQRRREAFLRQVKHYRYRELCPRSGIERLAANGEFRSDWLKTLGARPETVAERIVHLRQIIHDLEHHDNYELGLLTEEQASRYCRNLWTVKGSYSACIRMYHPSPYGGSAGVSLEIREPTIVAAFEDYFSHIWDSLKADSKDKRRTIAWLNGLVQSLEAQPAGAAAGR